MNQPLNKIWENLTDLGSQFFEPDQISALKACDLVEEKGQYILLAPNRFALSTVNELMPTLQLLLKKQNIHDVKLEIGRQDDLLSFQNKQKKENSKDKAYKSNLNPDYQFSNFVVGETNDSAFHAAKRVSEGLFNEGFNPLYIYGGTGLGKSHLMHAIGNTLRSKGFNRVIYLTAEDFTNDFVNAIRDPKNNPMEAFQEYYRNADALLIDDVQFIGDKNRSQMEFFHTYNALLDQRRPIVLTSDRLPREIEGLESRLQSRFGSGVTVSIYPPVYETRLAILKNKAEQMQADLPEEVAQYIAHNIETNVRELEGALKKVVMRAKWSNDIPNINIARAELGDMIAAQSKQINLPNIRKVVCNYYQITQDDLDSPSRKATVRLPRQVAMHLARNLTKLSTTEIGQNFGDRDHSTVINACKRIDEQLKKDHQFKEIYETIKVTIKG